MFSFADLNSNFACVIKIFDENTSDFHQVSPCYPNGIL